MTDLLPQLHTIAQGDTEGWVDLLVLVAMAIFWALAGVLRAGAKKRQQSARMEVPSGQQRRRQETWQQRLARKAEEMQRAMEAKERQTAERMRQWEERVAPRGQTSVPHPVQAPAPGQPRPGTLTVRPTGGGESILIYEPAEPSPGLGREELAARQREARRAVTAAGQTGKTPPTVQVQGETGLPSSEPLESMTSIPFEPPKPLEPGTEELAVSHGPAYDPRSIIDYTDPDALKKAILHYEILGKPVALRDQSEPAGLT